MKNLNLLSFCSFLLIFLLQDPVHAQDTGFIRCGTVEMDSVLRAQFPALGTPMDFEQALSPHVTKYNKIKDSLNKSVVVYTIPVIFHIIHNGENVGSGRNLNQDLIDAQIEQLNQDFRRNGHGWNNHPDGADVEITFCPALVDEDNNALAEAGINRIDRNTLGFTAPPYGVCVNNDMDRTYIQNTIKPVTQWDPDEYMNIWIMDLNCGVLGYAQFPEAPLLEGIDPGNGPANTDGVVLDFATVGSVDDPNPGGGNFNMGRTATHEVGHWLGLRHIWGDGNGCGGSNAQANCACNLDDFCDDTPNHGRANFGACNAAVTCFSQDMPENYMDYTNDACMNIFTQDQRTRMRIVMGETGAVIPRRGALLNSTKCTNSGCWDNAYEPNNSLIAANTTAFGSVLGNNSVNISRNAYISTSLDNDYYRINVDQAGELRIVMGSLPADYDLQLYNANYQQIDYSNNWGTNGEEVSVEHDQDLSTTFYLRVYGWNGVHNCAVWYTLNLTWTPDNSGGGGGGCNDTAYEPNNSFAAANTNAFPVVGATSVLTQQNAYISSTQDQDYYRITVTQPGELKFNLLSVPADYDLFLYNNNQFQVASSTNAGTNNEEVTLTYTGSGTSYYYVRVYGWSGAMSCGDSYILRMTWTPDSSGGGGGGCNDTAYEPNNSFGAAHSSAFPACGTSDILTPRNGYISSAQDRDYYRITVTNPGELKFTLYSLPGDYELRIYNSSQSLLSSSTNSGTNTEEVTVNYTGSGSTYYYVMVEGWSGAMSCDDSYILRLSWDAQSSGGGGGCNDTAYEPNNSFGQANSSIFPTCGSSGITQHRNAYISSTTDKDYYRITVTQPGQIKFTMYSLPGDYDLFLYNSNQSWLDDSEAGGTSTEEVVYNYTGSGSTYFYVKVIGYAGAMDCGDSYILRLTWTPSNSGGGNNGCADNNYEPNNSFGGANTSAFPTCGSNSVAVLRNGYISSTTDKDYFRITVTEPGELKVNLLGVPYDYDLFLYNQSQHEVDYSNAGGTSNEEVVTYYNGFGTTYYYVKVIGYNGAYDCDDNYTLRLIWSPESYITTQNCGNALQEQVGAQILSTGNTAYGTSYINEYSCGNAYNFDGNEVVYEYNHYLDLPFEVYIWNRSHPSLRVFIATDCDGSTCVAAGEESFGGNSALYVDYFVNAPPGTYYIIVDAPAGVTGTFDIDVSPRWPYVVFDDDGCADQVVLVPDQYTCNDDLSYNVEVTIWDYYEVNVPDYPYTFLGNDRYLIENIPSGESPTIELEYNGGLCFNTSTLATYECPCPEIPEPANPVSANICTGDPFPAIQVDAPTSIYQVNWYDAAEGGNWLSSEASFIPPALGTYYAEYTSLLNGCSSNRVPAKLTQSDAVELYAIIQDNQCFGEKEGTIELITQGGQPPFTFEWQDGDTRQVVDGLNAGNYAVTVTDSLGCQAVNTFKVGEPDKIIINQTGNTVLCPLGQNAELNINVEGGVAPYYYFWNTGSNQASTAVDSGGYYIAYVYDSNGCLAYDSITVEESPEIILEAAITEAACNGTADGQINLTASGGSGAFEYAWSTGSTSEDLIDLVFGDYEVTVTDANACSIVEVLNVPQASEIEVTAFTEEIACYGENNGAIDLTVDGGVGNYNYEWSNGAQSEDLSGLEPGIYTITITDANDCPAVASFNITQPEVIALETQQTNVTCHGELQGALELNLSGGTGQYTFAWSNGATTEDLGNLAAGQYVLTVTDENQCQLIENFEIVEPQSFETEILIQNIDCNGSNEGMIDLEVTGGTAPYGYLWSNGLETEDQAGLPADDYSVTVTDANGCETIAEASIEESSAMVLEALTEDVACNGMNSGTIDLSIAGGVGNYSFLWNNGSQQEDLTGLSAGTYEVTVTDANDCALTEMFTLSEPEALALEAQQEDMLCHGFALGVLDLTVSGGSGQHTFAWSNGMDTEDLDNLPSGQYTVTVTDENQCELTQTFEIAEPQAIETVFEIEDIACNGQGTGTLDLTVTGGLAPYTYLWNNGSQTEDQTGLPAGSYTVTIADVNNCEIIGNANIAEAAPLEMTALSEDVSCYGENTGMIDLAVEGGTTQYFYSWSNGMQSEDLSGLEAGIYQLTMTDANGCSLTEIFEITQPEAIQILENLTQPVCYGGSDGTIDLQISGGTGTYDYQWSNGSDTPGLEGISSGVYTVTVTDENGCSLTESYDLGSPETIEANVYFDEGCGNNTAYASASPNGGQAPYQYLWNSGQTTDEIYFLAPGNYTLTVTDALGCTSVNQFTIGEAEPISIVDEVDHVSCYGEADGRIELNVSGSVLPYEIHWDNGDTGAVLEDLGPGIYSATVFSANGCATNITFEIQEPAPLEAELDIIMPLSGDDGQATVIPSGGSTPYTINWSNGDTGYTADHLSAGTYEVIIQDANGCTITETFEIILTSDNTFRSSVVYRVYPNPTSGMFILKFEALEATDVRLALFSSTGKLIDRRSVHADLFTESFNLEALPAGMYFLEMDTDIGRAVEKIVLTD